MAYSSVEFASKVSEIVRDDVGKLGSSERDNFIQEAVKIYSRHRPREVVKDITGDGGYDYAIATNLTSWVKGFSIIKSIEYPADEREPIFLEEGSDEDFVVYEKEGGQYIRFFSDAPPATEKIRVVYTALHVVNDTLNTIPESDQDAVCNLAASLCSGALASAYAQTSDSTITADSVDHMSKSREYAARARVQKQTYMDFLGIKEGEVSPASAIKTIKVDYPGGGDRLTHPKKWR
jgi:hypothetical protein